MISSDLAATHVRRRTVLLPICFPPAVYNVAAQKEETI